MAQKRTKATIKGTAPLLMHAFPLTPVEGFEKMTPEDQAEVSAYRNKDLELYIPGVAIQRAMIAGGAYSKGKGRASLIKIIAAGMRIPEEHILLGTGEYSIDSRAVVNPTTKGRIVRHRPRIDNWQVTFDIMYDDRLLSFEQIKRVLEDTGTLVGILDFRPATKGSFGTFDVVELKEVV